MFAGPASAAEISKDGSTLVVRAAPGEANGIAPKPGGFHDELLQFSDNHPFTLGPGVACTTSTAYGGHFA